MSAIIVHRHLDGSGALDSGSSNHGDAPDVLRNELNPPARGAENGGWSHACFFFFLFFLFSRSVSTIPSCSHKYESGLESLLQSGNLCPAR